MIHSDGIAQACLSIWDELAARGTFKFLKSPLFTIMAGVILAYDSQVECISLGAGSKCLAQSQLATLSGDALHDSHAEVLARRGAIVWFLAEISRLRSDPSFESGWMQLNPETNRFALREGVTVHMYISALPCMSHLDAISNERGVLTSRCQAETRQRGFSHRNKKPLWRHSKIRLPHLP